MPYPSVERLELPILQELVATGGVEEVRFLYDRLAGYFPQLDEIEIRKNDDRHHRSWRRTVQRAGHALVIKRQIERQHGRWTITTLGRKRATDESLSFSFSGPATEEQGTNGLHELSHVEVQQMLVDIGRALGHYAEKEFDYYDVVWRANEMSQRLSHVFEVQRKGNIDAALAKLKRAYDAQRSKPYLVVATERDTNRAQRQLSLARTGPFHEIGAVTTIISFAQLKKLHCALTSVEDLLSHIIEQ